MSDPKPPFGRQLQALREQRHLSQARFAERIDCDHSYVSRIESGSRMPSREFVLRVVDGFLLERGDAAALLASAGYHADSISVGDPDVRGIALLLDDPAVPQPYQQMVRATLQALTVGAGGLSVDQERGI